MLVLRHRLAIAAVLTASAIAVPAAALASGPGSPSGKQGPPPAAVASGGKSAPAGSAPAAPPSGKVPPRGSDARGGKPAAPLQLTGLPAAASALATRLGVSITSAERAVKEIGGLIVQNGRVDPASPAFAAIARETGVSPAQLAAGWAAVSHLALG